MPNSDWMKNFTNRNDLTLTDITIPASHDAGVSEAHNERFKGLGPKRHAIAQEYDIAGQLAAGSRFFDLRFEKHGGILKTVHGVNMGRWGQDADTIFEQVDHFLSDKGKDEIVILRITHTKGSLGVENRVRAKIASSRRCDVCGKNLAQVALPLLKGRALIIFDKEALEYTGPIYGLHRFRKYDGQSRINSGLEVCGDYAGVFANFRPMVQTALEAGNNHGSHPRLPNGKHDHLFMVYWQLAFNIKNKTIMKRGDRYFPNIHTLNDNKGVHYNLNFLLNVHRGKTGMHRVSHRSKKSKHKKKVVTSNVTPGNRMHFRPNIINLDFVNAEVCNQVIAFNNDLLP